MFSELLATTDPSIRVQPNLIFARDGNVYSSGGVTAGIDLALALVEEDLGREFPLAVARTMAVFLRRLGGQSQFSAYLKVASKNRPDIGEPQAWILGHPGGRANAM
jgi:transcriptional regulator GlxA family with amidase domain